MLWFPTVAVAQSTLVYSDDFEAGASGWSNNSTDFDPDVTQFLGRFDNSPNATSRSFTLPPSTGRVEIVFDFYRFDSWDNTAQWGFDRFQVDVDGTQIFSLPFAATQAARSGTTGSVDWSHSPLGPTTELAFGTGQFWFDQLHRVTLTVNNPGSTLALTLRAALNQGGNDESGGFDNISITAFPILPDLDITKTVEMASGAGALDYAVPGADVIYRFDLTNIGGAVDAGTVRISDKIPDNLVLFTGNYDGSGNAVAFNDASAPASGLLCCAGGTVQFSDTTSGAPVYGYTPNGGYDPAVTYIQIAPSGTLRDGQTTPVDVDFSFRARID
ncbi:hypothetical protein [Fretibacter rubidus]|uniref:hypothetical protein n=1 Tax=Fretibacter rubidus TaxID=570162 RepID=UPI00352ACBF9